MAWGCRTPSTTRQTVASHQLQAGLPIVVPTALSLEGIDGRGVGAPASEVVHRGPDRPAVARTHITDDPVQVEQQDGPRWSGDEGGAGQGGRQSGW